MKKRNDNNLAEGEVTGHAHVACSKTATVYDEDENTRVLNAPNGTPITHEEHRTYEIPPNQYNVTHQREIDPDTEEIRSLKD